MATERHRAALLTLTAVAVAGCHLVFPYRAGDAAQSRADAPAVVDGPRADGSGGSSADGHGDGAAAADGGDAGRDRAATDAHGPATDARLATDRAARDRGAPAPDAHLLPDVSTILPMGNLVASYRFDNNLLDGTGHKHDLTGTGLGFTAGKHSSALSINAASSVETFPSTCAQGSAVLVASVDLWFRPASIPSTGRAMLFDNNNCMGIMIHPGGTVQCSAGQPGASAVLVSAGAAVAGVWAHVACVMDGQNAYLYIGGVLKLSGPLPKPCGAQPLCFAVGEDLPSYGDKFDGLVDDLHIWDGPLTQAQVQAAATLSF